MKKIAFLLLALVVSVSLVAQDEQEAEEVGGKYGDTPEDSLKCIQSLSLYSEFYKQENYKDAMTGWRTALNTCPASSKNLYIRGAKMIESFIDDIDEQLDQEGLDDAKKEELEAKMNAYVDTLLDLYDKRIENFGERGKVLGKKGVDMVKYRKDDPEAAFNTLKESFELEGNSFGPAQIVYMYLAKYYMVAKKMSPKQELIELYPQLEAVVAYNIANNEKYGNIYEKAGQNLEKYFIKVAECTDLVDLYTPKFEEIKGDADQLKTVLKVFKLRGCTDEELYLKSAVALNEIEPSAEASYGIAISMLKKERYSEAIDFFQKSIELREDDAQNFDAYLNMARAQLVSKNHAGAKNSAKKALSIDPNSGEALLIVGDAYGYGGKVCSDNPCESKAGWWLAYDYYMKAKSTDSSVAEKADKKMAAARSQFPGKEDCFFYSLTDGSSYSFENCWITESTTVRTK